MICQKIMTVTMIMTVTKTSVTVMTLTLIKNFVYEILVKFESNALTG